MTDVSLPDSDGGWIAAFASTAVSGLARARRALRDKLHADAAGATPGGYVAIEWVGWTEIRSAAAVIRRERARMTTPHNPYDHLEQALSECASVGKDEDPPVLLLGVLAVDRDPKEFA